YVRPYQYLVVQEQALGRGLGRDLSFSPDGNTIAIFGKRESGRSLILLDALNGGVKRIVDMPGIEQQLAPSWSPDGKTIAFSGSKDGRFDIFFFNVDSSEVRNFTNDDIFDGAPVFTPDGKSLIYVSVVGSPGHAKIFRSDLANPAQRFQLTSGDSDENDPILSRDGKQVFFTSDREGRENIYGLDLASGEVRQYTNVVTGAFMPAVFTELSGKEKLVFTGYWKQRMDLYEAEIDQPVKPPVKTQIAAAPVQAKDVPKFEPDIQVTLDPANKGRYSSRKFFLEDAATYIGVDSNQTYLGRILLAFSDYLGDHRILADLSSVDSFSNFNITYGDYSHRWQWEARVFDDRAFFVSQDLVTGRIIRDRTAYRQTGALGALIYPLSFDNRAEFGVGYMSRDFFAQEFAPQPDGTLAPVLVPIKDNFPMVIAGLVSDSTLFAGWGPVAGHRVRLDVNYAFESGGTEFTSTVLEARQYVPVTQRSNLALRLFGAMSNGRQPSPIYFGGLDTIRGFDYRSLSGDRGFFANLEYRFPLLDVVATPILAFQGIRGNLFIDAGGAWYHNFQSFEFYNSKAGRLQSGIAAYGWGFTIRFIGVDLNWDFAKTTDLKTTSKFNTTFWIGTRF
ncbi:MAG TPA: BamA/TamA family outer membrane protein, partial [Solirubrobacterales bacterium]|nr:BamA/TamA family outer membrane protein [Solirubrobacterales bacterium]